MALPLTYNWRNVLVRKVSTVLTFVVVAVVVFVLAVLLSFAAGIRASLAASGHPRNLIVLAPGATSESTSIILPDEAPRVVQAPGVARGTDGAMLISQELAVQTSIARVGPEGNPANVAVRGVDDVAFLVHPDVRIVEGRAFQQGAQELIVGRAAQERYQGLHVGAQLHLGRNATRTFTVVGVFESGGNALESELWGPRTMIGDAYNRRLISSAVIRIDDAASLAAAIDYINGASVNLEAQTELEYYDELATTTRQIVFLTTLLITIMAIGAAFAVANTMYAAVDGRRREIATLRTLGFGRVAILTAFLTESLLICVPACVFGLLCALALSGMRQDYLSDITYTVLAYELTLSPPIFAAGLLVSVLVGVMGSLAPALRASRTPIIESLRKA